MYLRFSMWLALFFFFFYYTYFIKHHYSILFLNYSSYSFMFPASFYGTFHVFLFLQLLGRHNCECVMPVMLPRVTCLSQQKRKCDCVSRSGRGDVNSLTAAGGEPRRPIFSSSNRWLFSIRLQAEIMKHRYENMQFCMKDK